MPGYHNMAWKKFPFLKLFLSLAAGILIQWHGNPDPGCWWWMIAFFLPLQFSFFFIPFFERFKLSFLPGIATIFLFSALGGLLVSQKDPRNRADWIGHTYQDGDIVSVMSDEPPVEKERTFKVNATIQYISRNGSLIPAGGKIILYFRKQDPGGNPDTALLRMGYGAEILFKGPLQLVMNSGNPGGFDYKQYCLFRGITHQSFLKNGEYLISPRTKKNWFRQFLYITREKVLAILRENITGEKETGLAEALLIGYKDDLDPALVQSYTNTGVVHIIAISGLHIGLVYWLLVQLFRPLRKSKATRPLIPLFIIAGLWLFSFLAGAQPSILRSALMFTCIVIGENISRKTSIFNTLSLSAFILLCINPFWLWNAGFQLSYAAVLSIIIFFRPVYNWFYFKNKVLDHIWKLNAVTLAAQVFTLPLCIYHFQQFPNYFLLSNFLAVPLSSIILIGEIFLCAFSIIPFIAGLTGKILGWLINLMNNYIGWVESIPHSLADGLLISFPQVILLFLFVACTGHWLLERSKKIFQIGMLSLLGFVLLRSLSFIEANKQKKLIVYNIPKKTGIDLVLGRRFYFIGDSDLVSSHPLYRFNLKPSRTRSRVKPVQQLDQLFLYKKYIHFGGLHILHANKPVNFEQQEPKPVIDIVILSGNPTIYMQRLAASLEIRQVVFDGSVPAWKSRYWKKDCDALQIPWHDVIQNGAFEMSFR